MILQNYLKQILTLAKCKKTLKTSHLQLNGFQKVKKDLKMVLNKIGHWNMLQKNVENY